MVRPASLRATWLSIRDSAESSRRRRGASPPDEPERLLREIDVPERRPRHRDIAREFCRGSPKCCEMARANIRTLVVDDFRNLAPEGAALGRVGLAVEGRECGVLGRRRP